MQLAAAAVLLNMCMNCHAATERLASLGGVTLLMALLPLPAAPQGPPAEMVEAARQKAAAEKEAGEARL